MMKHSHLLALEAIVTTGTFRGAAERLHKSQSAISHMIRQLEDALDFRVLSREAYRPTLTAEGQVFYREATRVLTQMRELNATATRLKAREEPELRLAVSATLPLELLLPMLGELGAQFPATHLRLSTEMMGGAIARLIEGRAEVAISTLDGVPLEEVETRPMAVVMIRPVASPALAEKLGAGPLPLSAMQAIPQVVVAGTAGAEDSQSRDLLPGGRRWTVSDFAAKKQVLLSGLGWGGMPDHLIRQDVSEGTLIPIEVDGFRPRRSEIFAIRRKDTAPGPAARAFWTLVSQIKEIG
ncbi:LysR family transcriptional regulator [Arenibacterium sp. LLYu02]|uniref:LysR family transcriptional regulator n=1 Tax=Arenibacterium sp. LLYu02 TaxID=3404132 RepID=UPI003B216EA8